VPMPSGPPYRNEEGGFEIQMPDAPKEDVIPLEGTKVLMHMASATWGDATYYAGWLDFPVGAKIDVDGALRGAEKNVCMQDAVDVNKRRTFQYDDRFTAHDLVATSKNATPWKDMIRTIFVDGRTYIVLVRGVRDEASARTFLDSFHLIEDAPAKSNSVVGTLGPASATFPGEPTEAITQQQGPNGPMPVRTLRLTQRKLDIGIELAVDPKPGPEASLDPQKRLDGVRDLYVKTFGGDVKADERVTVSSLPARHLKLDLGDRGVVELIALFPKKDTMILGTAATRVTAADADRAAVRKFIASLAVAPTSSDKRQ